jgi:hypothetical protein
LPSGPREGNTSLVPSRPPCPVTAATFAKINL